MRRAAARFLADGALERVHVVAAVRRLGAAERCALDLLSEAGADVEPVAVDDATPSRLESLEGSGPDLLLDDGGRLAGCYACFGGVCERSVAGVVERGALPVGRPAPAPVIALGDSSLRRVVGDRSLAAHVVSSVLPPLLGGPATGRRICVAGYGSLGAEVARHARAAGAEVTIVENRAREALAAVLDRHASAKAAEAASVAEAVVVTSARHVPPADALARLPNGAVALALTDGAAELLQARLAEVAVPAPGPAYELRDGGSIVFAAVTEGPPERDELALAQALLAAHYLARFDGLPRVVQSLPRDLERVLAELKLEELGVAIDTMPPARRAFE